MSSSHVQGFEPAPAGHPGIPLARLADTSEPILFFNQVTLYEDELHDNGLCDVVVRVVRQATETAPCLFESLTSCSLPARHESRLVCAATILPARRQCALQNARHEDVSCLRVQRSHSGDQRSSSRLQSH